MFTVSIAAVTSLMRAPVGDIVAVPGGEQFARAVLAEAAAAAQAAGHPVPGEELQLTEQTLTTAGSPVTASMSRDLLAGRRTEADVLGEFEERARAAGAPAPLIEVGVLALRVHNRRVHNRRVHNRRVHNRRVHNRRVHNRRARPDAYA